MRLSTSQSPTAGASCTSGACCIGSRLFIFFALAIGGTALDLWSKHYMFSELGDGTIYWVIQDFFGFQTALNTGALFGFGSGQVSLFAGLSVVAAIGICIWMLPGKAYRDLWLTIALGGIMGGIFGNLYDRLGLWGGVDAAGEPILAVRDWILFRFGSFTWPNFNVADCLLVGGAGMLMMHALLQGNPKEAKTT